MRSNWVKLSHSFTLQYQKSCSHYGVILLIFLSENASVSSPVRSKEPSIATANNIDTLLGATETSEIVQPPESVQDKVHFIFNNISQTNLQQKVSQCFFTM